MNQVVEIINGGNEEANRKITAIKNKFPNAKLTIEEHETRLKIVVCDLEENTLLEDLRNLSRRTK